VPAAFDTRKSYVVYDPIEEISHKGITEESYPFACEGLEAAHWEGQITSREVRESESSI
jgi:hypothetical protein